MTTTFDALYLHELELLASAEDQTLLVLPKLALATDTAELRRALEDYADSCRVQQEALHALLVRLHSGKHPRGCNGMTALLRECVDVLADVAKGNLRDAVLIAHLQRADHYKIAAYGSVHDYAKLLGLKHDAERLDHASKAVVAASKLLGQIAIQVNAEAYVDTRVEVGSRTVEDGTS